MDNKIITVLMTEQEAVRYYANKIIEDSLADCSEFNYCMSVKFNYNDNEFVKQHQKQILEVIKQDERISDVYAEIEDTYYTYDMVFWTDYCPHYYEEYDLSKEMQIMILEKFISQLVEFKKIWARVFNTNTQELIKNIISINNFEKKLLKEENGQAINMLKEIICNTEFFNKYLDKYKVIVNKQNVSELITELKAKLQNISD